MIFIVFLFLSMVEGSMFPLERISSQVDFTVAEDPFYPIYITTVKMGSPPQNFTVLFDTGSDISWVPCKSPEGIFNQYDVNVSSTETVISCPQKFCKCSSSQMCEYGITYDDKITSSSGYFVQDWFLIESNKSEARFNFGCSMYENGTLLNEHRGFDGILGFGRGPYSLPSQLRLNAFSYCFNKGIKNGFLLFGEAIHVGLTYTPMIPSMSIYGLFLEKIIVDGVTLPVKPEIFKPSKHNGGTIIDSGTEHFLLIEEAYDELITVVKFFLPSTTIHKRWGIFDCFSITTSVAEAFPIITLIFSQNAKLVISPNQYVFQLLSNDVENNIPTWCIGIIKWKGKTILGDIIFKNKLIVYDLARERVGWTDFYFNCSMSDKNLDVDLHFIDSNNNSSHPRHVRYNDVIFVLTLTFVILIFRW